MWQVIYAARHCSDWGGFHWDIKMENILLNPGSLKINLIDFGCEDLLKNTPYIEYAGTKNFRPPKWIVKGEYEAEHATVWGLGVFLYQLLCGEELFCEVKDIVDGHVDFPDHLSEGEKNTDALLYILTHTQRWITSTAKIARIKTNYGKSLYDRK